MFHIPDTQAFFDNTVFGVLVAAVIVFVALRFVSAPYGKHERDGWGPTLPSRLGWVLMESPAVLLYIAIFSSGQFAAHLVPCILLGVWQLHYIHRTFIFPFRMRIGGKTMPLTVALMATFFNSVNAYINARFISHYGEYADSWLSDPRFIVGVSLFLVGMFINIQSDQILLNLRKPGETGYKIPSGGLYRWLSSPNYFGELLEWLGWAIATWSLSGLAFFVFTAANLVPRALTNHAWYQEKFGSDYPKERKAVIPGVY